MGTLNIQPLPSYRAERLTDVVDQVYDDIPRRTA